jgi:hypothetical protein
VSQVRMVIDPQGWFHDVKGIGEGLVWGVAHPVAFAKAIADWDTWLENPARAAGRLVPDIALLLATAGAGDAGGRGARAAERAAGAAKDLHAADRAVNGGTSRVRRAVKPSRNSSELRHARRDCQDRASTARPH